MKSPPDELRAYVTAELMKVLGSEGYGSDAMALLGAVEESRPERALTRARAVLASSYGEFHEVADVMTYWDAVPEALQAVHAAAALVVAALEGSMSRGTLRSVDAAITAATAGGPAERIRRLRTVRGDVPETTTGDFVTDVGPLPEVPALLNVDVSGWRAFEWTSAADVFRDHSDRFVPVEDAGRHRILQPPLPPGAYLAQHRLFDQIPALASFIAPSKTSTRCAWIAVRCHRGAKTPRHADPYDNLVVQILGTKRWSLWHPTSTHDRPPNNNSDEEENFRFDLGPGDVLFVPAGWPHAVSSIDHHLSDSIAVNYWFRRDDNHQESGGTPAPKTTTTMTPVQDDDVPQKKRRRTTDV